MLSSHVLHPYSEPNRAHHRNQAPPKLNTRNLPAFQQTSTPPSPASQSGASASASRPSRLAPAHGPHYPPSDGSSRQPSPGVRSPASAAFAPSPTPKDGHQGQTGERWAQSPDSQSPSGSQPTFSPRVPQSLNHPSLAHIHSSHEVSYPRSPSGSMPCASPNESRSPHTSFGLPTHPTSQRHPRTLPDDRSHPPRTHTLADRQSPTARSFTSTSGRIPGIPAPLGIARGWQLTDEPAMNTLSPRSDRKS